MKFCDFSGIRLSQEAVVLPRRRMAIKGVVLFSDAVAFTDCR